MAEIAKKVKPTIPPLYIEDSHLQHDPTPFIGPQP